MRRLIVALGAVAPADSERLVETLTSLLERADDVVAVVAEQG
jgi:hypothetical protein